MAKKNWERFENIIKTRFSPEQILKLNRISLKEYLNSRKEMEMRKIEALRISLLNYSNSNIEISKSGYLQNQNVPSLVLLFTTYLKHLGILGIYYFIPGWYILGFSRFLMLKNIRIVTAVKWELRVYNHRLTMNKKLRAIEVDRGLLISIIPFLFSLIQYIIFRFKPHLYPNILEDTLPLFAYPIQTIKWDTLMLSDDAQEILVREKNSMGIFDDYLLIHRRNNMKLFGNTRWGNYLLVPEGLAGKNIHEAFLNLDSLPKKLASTKQVTYEYPPINNYIKFLDSQVSFSYKRNAINKRELYQARLNFDYLIRTYYTNFLYDVNDDLGRIFKIFRKKVRKAKRRRGFSQKYSAGPKQVTSVREFASLDDFNKFHEAKKIRDNGPPLSQLDPNYLDYEFELDDVFKETFTLKSNEYYQKIFLEEQTDQGESEKALTSPVIKSDNTNTANSITSKDFYELYQFISRFVSHTSSNLKEKLDKDTTITKRKIPTLKTLLNNKLGKLSETEVSELLAILTNFYNENQKVFISCNLDNKKPRLLLKPRKMSGYVYPDTDTKEVSLLRLREFLFPNESKNTVRVELPPNFAFVKTYTIDPPEPPDPKNLLVATAVVDLTPEELKERKKTPKIDRDAITLVNQLDTPIYVDGDPDDPGVELQANDPRYGKFHPHDYRGPALLLNENNDIRVINAVDKNKPFISKPKDSAPILNVSLNYYLGINNNKILTFVDPKTLPPQTEAGVSNISKENISQTKQVVDTLQTGDTTEKTEADIKENPSGDEKNESTLSEPNVLKPWLVKYHSPDNPLVPKDMMYAPNMLMDWHKLQAFNRTLNNDLMNVPVYSAEFEILRDEYSYAIRKKNYNKKWYNFPFLPDYYEAEGRITKNYPFRTKQNLFVVATSPEDWAKRFASEKVMGRALALEATKDIHNFENYEYEKLRSIRDLTGYMITNLPTTKVYYPQVTKEKPRLNYKLVSELDYSYSPFAASLFNKIALATENPHVEETLCEEQYGKVLSSGTYQTVVKKGENWEIDVNVWEPLTTNSWLIITQVSFGYICCLILKETMSNYGREFLSYLIDIFNTTGFLPPMMFDELKMLIGEKETGFRVTKEFTKGFQDVVDIGALAEELLDTLLYLRGMISDPALAKHAQSLLLVGPPGTGKTLLVHALAEEAKVPVLTLTAQGSKEPAALERLFTEARKLSPCIVFLDEVDSIGAARSGMDDPSDSLMKVIRQGLDSSSNAARRSRTNNLVPEMSTIMGDINPRVLQNKEMFHKLVNTDVQNHIIKKNEDEYYRVGLLLKLLTELDGIESRDGIVIIGATNRVDVLDPALLRPGRFIRKVRLGLPNKTKRLKLFQHYSYMLGSDPNIPWDYLVKLTYGFSAADIATIMNESGLKAIAQASHHTLATIEHGIDRLTTTSIAKGFAKDRKTEKGRKEFFFSTARSAYYQAAKALVGTLLKYHPPVIVVHLWYRHYSVRYNQIQRTVQLEWLKYVCRGELEHRIIGAYAGKAGEYLFLQEQSDYIDMSDNSNIGAQDWAIGQALVKLLVEHWYMYTETMLLREPLPIRRNFNSREHDDIREQYLFEFAQTYETTPTAAKLLHGKSPQTRFPQKWWHLKIYQKYLDFEIQKWSRIYIPNPEEWKYNPYWVGPDRTFHQNNTATNIGRVEKLKDLAMLTRDYKMHSIIMESFNLAFLIVTDYRELLDQLAYELLHDEILREHTIYEIFSNFGFDCDNLKEDLRDAPINIEPLPEDFKILNHFWGLNSDKPTMRWIDIAAMLHPENFPEETDEGDDASIVSENSENSEHNLPNNEESTSVTPESKEIDGDQITEDSKNAEEGENAEEGDEGEEGDEAQQEPIEDILGTFYSHVIKPNPFNYKIEEEDDNNSNSDLIIEE